jgi:iron(III) transport system permease protein
MASVALHRKDDRLSRFVVGRPGTTTALFTVVLGVVAFLVLFPLVLVLLKSFDAGLDNWRSVVTQPRMLDAIRNTITLALTRQAIALVLGFAIAWVIARTRVPGRGWLEFGFWVALFMPALTVTLGWVSLFDEIFSWWGIVFVHLMTGTLAMAVLLLTPALRRLDGALEEASVTLGAGTLRTLWRVVTPALAPTIVVVTLLGIVSAMQAFEVELVLGARDQVEILSTVIYDEVRGEIPQYGNASALGMMLLMILAPVIALQQWISARRAPSLGRSQRRDRMPTTLDLGRWMWPTFAVIAGLVLMLTMVPVALVVASTFSADGAWTLQAWRDTATDAGVLRALGNSLALGFGSALVAVVAFTTVAYITVRTRFFGRGPLKMLAYLPGVVPGVVLSLGLLLLFTQIGPLRSLVMGTRGALIIALALGGASLGVQILRTSLASFTADAEAASVASGASTLTTFRRILVPLVMPAATVVAVLTFATAVRATSVVALLTTDETKPLSLLQLDQAVAGEYAAASIVGVTLIVLVTGVAVSARLFGMQMRNESGD